MLAMNFGRRIQIGATLKPELIIFVHFSVSRFDSLKIALDNGLLCPKIILIQFFIRLILFAVKFTHYRH